MQRAAAIVFWLCVSLWLAALVAPAVAAIGAFSTLPKMGLALPEFESFAQGDAQVMGRIAAGKSLQPLFSATALAQRILAPVTLIAAFLALAGGGARRSLGRTLLWLALATATAVVIAQAMLEPQTNDLLQRYWSEAAAGKRVPALEAKASFDALHWWSQRLSELELAALLLGIGAAAAVHAPRRVA